MQVGAAASHPALRLVVAAVSGVVLGLAFEPVAWPYLMPVAIAGLDISTRGAGRRLAVASAYVFGLTFMLVTMSWLSGSISPSAWIGLSAVQALWFAALGVMFTALGALPASALWKAAAWAALEVFRGSVPFGGLTWARLAFATIDTPWARLTPFTGVVGTGFVVALLGTSLAWAAARPFRIRRVATIFILGVVSTTPAWFVVASGPSDRFRVSVIQGDVPGTGTDVGANHRQVTANLVETTLELAADPSTADNPPQLVVWPENSTAIDPLVDIATRNSISRAAAAIERPILVGAMVDGPIPTTVLNQGILWDPATGPRERYTKQHPVPFGEYVPFRGLLGGRVAGLNRIPRDMLPGGTAEPISVGGTKVGIAICFDIAFDNTIKDHVRRGAQLLVVQTSNATFINTAQVDQQFAITRLRAIETGRSIAVASTNGISGIVNPDGTIAAVAVRRTQQALTQTVSLRTDLTLSMQFGAAS